MSLNKKKRTGGLFCLNTQNRPLFGKHRPIITPFTETEKNNG